jgi:hypothetical protein
LANIAAVVEMMGMSNELASIMHQRYLTTVGLKRPAITN